MNFSIKWKLAAAYFVLIVVILGFTNFTLLNMLEREYLRDRETTYLANANIVATAGQNTLFHADRSAYYLARDFGTRMGVRVLVLDRQGKVMVDSFGEGWLEDQVLQNAEVISALAGSSSTGVHIVNENERVLYVAVPATRDKAVDGVIMLVVGLEDLDEMLAQIRGRMSIVSLAGVVAAVLLSLFLAGFLTRPLKELTGAARQMSKGNLDQRIPVRGQDELGQMAGAFNDMSCRLVEAERVRRRFLADASHELKSPLSSVKVLAQSLIDTDEKEPRVYREYLEDINIEVDRLARIVNSMLQLTKLEEDDLPVVAENENIGSLVDHVMALMQPRAEATGVRLLSEGGTDLYWPVNRDLFLRILVNLVDNALRHTLAEGMVSVKAGLKPEGLSIEVVDTGEGIPAEDLPRVFDRFYRVDQARARSSGGTGLGLAIVHQAVQRHGGRISVSSQPGRGTVFKLVFPRSAAVNGNQ